MAEPPASPAALTLDELGERSFSFYPPIVNIEHNEWRFLRGSWSEVLVRNPKGEVEVWIPRSYVGEISRVEAPVMIVGLRRELEYKGGTVWPYARRIVEMPRPLQLQVSAAPPGKSEEKHEPIASFRREGGAESFIGRLIFGVLAAALLVTLVVAVFLRRETSGGAVEYKAIFQTDLALSAADDYFDVVRKLGAPASDRWRAASGERQYRALGYPKLRITVILMGGERKDIHYIGAKDDDWKTVHSVELPGGIRTDSVLRSLPRF